jgi:cytidine deaminase
MALDQVFFHKNRRPELCVVVGRLPETKWRRKWSDDKICTPCGVCLESFKQAAQMLKLKDIDFLCSSHDGKKVLRAKLSELLPSFD